jgi:hypothetical protein
MVLLTNLLEGQEATVLQLPAQPATVSEVKPSSSTAGLKFGSVKISIATETVSGGTCLTYIGLP